MGCGELALNFEISAYPNPGNSEITLNWGIEEPGQYDLRVYNVLGQEVKELFSNKQEIGFYDQTIQTGSWASGIYFAKLRSRGVGSVTVKLVLVK